MNASHLTADQLAMLADGRLDVGHVEEARLHIAECETCRQVLQTVKEFDNYARTLPHERAEVDFSDRVMGMLPRRAYNPVSLRILTFGAPVVGTLLVLSAIGVAFFLGGKTIGEPDAAWVSMFTDGYDRVGRVAGTLVHGIIDAVIRFAPFLRDQYAVGVSLFALAAVAFLATVDRFILRKLEGR